VHYLRQIQRGIDYIEAHLDEDIQAGDVARAAGISHWHFQRTFRALSNETLKTYIRSRRFAGALDALASSDARILEIALGAGFETQESFTRAFKKAFGVTPAAYRKQGSPFPFLRKVRFDEEYLRHLHANVSLEPEVYDQPAMHLVGLRTRFFSVDSEKNNIAGKLPPLWEAFLAKLPSVEHAVAGTCFGVVRQTPDRTDQLEYHAAIEVSRTGVVPAGMVHLETPPGRYARFTHVGKVAGIDRTVNYIYSSWLARSGMRHTYAADLEFYDARYHPSSEQSIIRYAIPVARVEDADGGER
jgi:AraC family transcriptional regulator